MTLDTVSLYLTSKYEVGSSKTYILASYKSVIKIVNLYNSPPDRLSIFLSNKCLSSKISTNS